MNCSLLQQGAANGPTTDYVLARLISSLDPPGNGALVERNGSNSPVRTARTAPSCSHVGAGLAKTVNTAFGAGRTKNSVQLWDILREAHRVAL